MLALVVARQIKSNLRGCLHSNFPKFEGLRLETSFTSTNVKLRLRFEIWWWWINPLQTLSQGLVLTLRFTFDPELDNLS